MMIYLALLSFLEYFVFTLSNISNPGENNPVAGQNFGIILNPLSSSYATFNLKVLSALLQKHSPAVCLQLLSCDWAQATTGPASSLTGFLLPLRLPELSPAVPPLRELFFPPVTPLPQIF